MLLDGYALSSLFRKSLTKRNMVSSKIIPISYSLSHRSLFWSLLSFSELVYITIMFFDRWADVRLTSWWRSKRNMVVCVVVHLSVVLHSCFHSRFTGDHVATKRHMVHIRLSHREHSLLGCLSFLPILSRAITLERISFLIGISLLEPGHRLLNWRDLRVLMTEPFLTELLWLRTGFVIFLWEGPSLWSVWHTIPFSLSPWNVLHTFFDEGLRFLFDPSVFLSSSVKVSLSILEISTS